MATTTRNNDLHSKVNFVLQGDKEIEIRASAVTIIREDSTLIVELPHKYRFSANCYDRIYKGATLWYRLTKLDRLIVAEITQKMPRVIWMYDGTTGTKGEVSLSVLRHTDCDKFNDREMARLRFNFLRSSVWSVHNNYEPNKRITLALHPNLRRLRGVSPKTTIVGFISEHQTATSSFIEHNSWLIFPLEWIDIWFSNSLITHQNIPSNAIDVFVASLANQPHDEDQYIELISILSTIEMMANRGIEYTLTEHIKKFWCCARILTGYTQHLRPAGLTESILFEELSKVSKILPYSFEELSDTVTGTIEQCFRGCTMYENLSSLDKSNISNKCLPEWHNVRSLLPPECHMNLITKVINKDYTDLPSTSVIYCAFKLGAFRFLIANTTACKMDTPKAQRILESRNGDAELPPPSLAILAEFISQLRYRTSVFEAMNEAMEKMLNKISPKDFLIFVVNWVKFSHPDHYQAGLMTTWLRCMLLDQTQLLRLKQAIEDHHEHEILHEPEYFEIKNLLLIMSGKLTALAKIVCHVEHNDKMFRHSQAFLMYFPELFNHHDHVFSTMIAGDDPPEETPLLEQDAGPSNFIRAEWTDVPIIDQPKPKPKFVGTEIKDPIFSKEQDRVEGANLFKRMRNKMCMPFTAAARVANRVGNEIEDIIQIKNKLTTLLENNKATFAAQRLSQMDFGSISSSYESVSLIANTLFQALLKQIAEWLHIPEPTADIEATTLVLYYLIWVKTDSVALKTWIICDLLIKCGVMDLIVRILKIAYKAMASVWGRIKSTGSYQDAMKEEAEAQSGFAAQYALKKDAVKGEEQEPDPDEEDESWFSSILEHITNGTPAVLGALAAATITALGLKVALSNTDSIGKAIVQGARNISFLTLAVGSMPKLFSYAVSTIQWVTDKIKSLFLKNHKTALQRRDEIVDWINRVAVYQTGMIEHGLASSLSLCLQFEADFVKGIELKQGIHLIEDFALRNQFNAEMLRLSKTRAVSNAYKAMHTGIDEPMSIVVTGSPGIGKTDVSQKILTEVGSILSDQTSFYPMNDALSYMDNYVNQELGYIDDSDISDDVDVEKVIMKMMMFSGFSTIANMASLESKGTILKFRLVVANTNSAYVKYKKILCNEAIQRRRILVRCEVLPEYLTDGKLDDAKLVGVNRSAGAHFKWCVLDSVHEGSYVLFQKNDPKCPEYLTTEQLIDYLKARAKTHKQRELVRSVKNGVDYGSIRARVAELEAAYLSVIEQVKTPNDMLQMLQKNIDALKLTNESHFGKLVADACLPSSTTVKQHNQQKPGNTDFALNCHKDIWTVHHSKMFKALRITGPIDFEKFHLTEKEFSYSGPIDETNRDTLHYYFTKFLVTDGYKYMRYELDLEIAKQKAEGRFAIYKIQVAKRMSYLYDFMKDVFLRSATTIMSCIKEGVLAGAVVAIGVCTLFFTLSVVGSLLSPESTSYNGKAGKIKVTAANAGYYSSITAVAEKSIYQVGIRNPETGITMESQAVGLRGNIFLVNLHAAAIITRETTITIWDPLTCLGRNEYVPEGKSIGPDDVYPLPDSDAALIVIKGYRSVKDCIHLWVTEDDLGTDMENFRDFDGMLVSARHGKIYVDERQNLTSTRYGSQEDFQSKRNIRFLSPTQAGQSGAVLMHLNTKVSRPFIGIQMSSDMLRSWVTVVTQDMINAVLNKIQSTYKIQSFQPDLEPVETHPLQAVTNNPLFESPYSNQSVSTACEFEKTPIHGTFPVDTVPAIVSPRDPRCFGKQHPYTVALNKYVTTTDVRFTEKERVSAIKCIENLYKEVPNIYNSKVVGTTEAITGTRSHGSTSIDTSTSPGLPYKDRTTKKGKQEYIKYNEAQNSWEISHIVFDDVAYYEECYTRLQIPENYKVEFQKHELVGQAKIDTPKTRTVATGNMIHLIIYRKIFSDMMRIVKNTNHGRHFCAVGLNPERDWDNLAVDNLRHLHNVISIDVKSWESVVNLSLMQIVTQGKINVLKEAYRRRGETLHYEAEKIAHCLAVDYTDAYVAFEDIIFRKRKGMLSGHPGTLVENSDMHAAILYTIWCRAVTKRGHEGLATFEAWRHHMRFVLAADDVLIAMSNKGRSIISVQDIVDEYQVFGIQVTAADKSADFKFENLTDVEFLKAGFQIRPEGYVIKPNLSIVHQLLNWVRKNKNPRSVQFETNVLTAMRFAWYHGPEAYENMRIQLNDALHSEGCREFTIDYNEMHRIISRDELAMDAIQNENDPQRILKHSIEAYADEDYQDFESYTMKSY